MPVTMWLSLAPSSSVRTGITGNLYIFCVFYVIIFLYFFAGRRSSLSIRFPVIQSWAHQSKYNTPSYPCPPSLPPLPPSLPPPSLYPYPSSLLPSPLLSSLPPSPYPPFLPPSLFVPLSRKPGILREHELEVINSVRTTKPAPKGKPLIIIALCTR